MFPNCHYADCVEHLLKEPKGKLKWAITQDWEVIWETWLFSSIENPIPARRLPVEDIPDIVCLDSQDIDLTWRGDGKYLATASCAQTGELMLSLVGLASHA